MHLRRAANTVLIALFFVTARPAFPQQTVDFSGRVFDATSKQGIENLEVTLTPPKQSRLSIRVASTNRDGVFAFTRLARSRYLVEVSQGLHLLYRAEVDATTRSRLDIPLQRKG